jgi:hypothetical protein
MVRFCSLICAAFLAVNVASAQSDPAPLTSNQWIQPAEAGTLVGRVILPSDQEMAQAVAGATVVVGSVDGGGVRGRAVTDETGDFVITGVTPGVYSLISRADNVFAHTVIHVIDSTADLGGRYPNVAEIGAANIPFETVQATILRYRPPSGGGPVTMANADLDALAGQVVNDDTFRVAQFDGGLSGRLYLAGAEGPNLIPAPMTNVFLMKDGVEVGRAITNQTGDFQIEELEVGNYSLVAIGHAGISVTGFDLVAASTAANAFACQLDPFLTDKVIIGSKIVSDEILDAGCGTSMAGGGFGGGGGGGGGFGDIGGLAAIAAVIAIAATNDDDDNGIRNPPLPATPVLP